MSFFTAVDAPPNPEPMKFPVFSLMLSREFRLQETGFARDCPLRQGVCLTGAFHGCRRKDPAFAGSVSLDETRERDVLATSRLALATFL